MQNCKIRMDFDTVIGRIKPMHAVNRVPCVPYDDHANNLFDKLAEAGVPYVRLHDVGGQYGGAHYVDISNVFPSFDADENDPASYDFTLTDRLLDELTGRGIEPFYRLGQTIENYQHIKPYHIYPPADFHKWARICEHIVRHYNEGWANGFHMDIRYWEIWNEPDNQPDVKDNPMWKGTEEQFFELYDITSRHLKACFPGLRIGGYGSCGFYALTGADCSAIAHSSPRKEYFIGFMERFLDYAAAHGSVIDFFSWHSYASNKDNVRYAAYARRRMNEAGYPDCEIFLNEWNPGIALRGSQKDAANILSGMCCMQNTPTDMCMYYDAQMVSPYCGLFDPVKHDVFNAYYAFYLFGKLYALQKQTVCEVLQGEGTEPVPEVFALAASDGKTRAALIVNSTGETVRAELRLHGAAKESVRVLAVDEEHRCEPVSEKADALTLPPYGIRYIEYI
ncbi:MAG: hypothetical protein ACI4RV_01340 [Eubacteriales bacterium]